MTRYHINPSTGDPSVCRAKIKCPFGDVVHEHFDSAEAARQSYERVMAAKELYQTERVFPYHFEVEAGAQATLDLLSEIGEPLIVGGAVRDSILGVENKDIDIEVHHTTIDAIMRKLTKEKYIVDSVGKQFGVLKVRNDRLGVDDLDVAVPRRENRTGVGHRDFEIYMEEGMTLTEAAERRDFTFNAMMVDARRGLLVDPTGGREDLDNRIIRHVSEKFAEDPLRVLRGFQFASRFGMTVDPKTAELARSLRAEYPSLSIERVQEEWAKFFTKGRHASAGVRALQAMGWDDTHPGLREALSDEATVARLGRLQEVPSEKRVVMGAAIIGKKIGGEDGDSFSSKFVLGKAAQIKAQDLAHTDPSTLSARKDRKAYALKLASRGFTFEDYKTYASLIDDEAGVRVANAAINDGVGLQPEPDLIMGRDLQELTDRKPGPWMGQLLREARDRQYSDLFIDKSDALAWVKEQLNS